MKITATTDGGNDATPVPWWSFGKTCLSAAVLVLVSQQKALLDEPLKGKDYSLRQLLQHTAGLPDYSELKDYHLAVEKREPAWSEEELKTRMKSLPFTKPGEYWKYSNYGYLQVRHYLEEITGKNIEQALYDLVFTRLEISSVKVAKTGEIMSLGDYDPHWVYHGLLAGGAYDAVRLLQGIAAGELFPAPVLNEMLAARHLNAPSDGRPWKSPAYGLGLIVASDSPAGKAYGHTGQGPGSVFAAYHFPELAMLKTAAVFETIEDQAEVENALVELVLG